MMQRSIGSRAGGAEIPRIPPDSVLAEDAEHSAESCVHCHGAPGREPAEWSRGMRPEPQYLTEAAPEWSDQEIHWFVTNGIKMTAMPAFGAHHSAEEIAAITAFVSALPGLTPDDYAALAGTGPHRSGQASPPPAGEPGKTPVDPGTVEDALANTLISTLDPAAMQR